jgi:hypothetical protein
MGRGVSCFILQYGQFGVFEFFFGAGWTPVNPKVFLANLRFWANIDFANGDSMTLPGAANVLSCYCK